MLTILQLVVLSRGHLRNTKTYRADAVSASFISALQIGDTRTPEDADVINSTQARDDDVNRTKTDLVEVNRTKAADAEVNRTKTQDDDVNRTTTDYDKVNRSKTDYDKNNSTKTEYDQVNRTKTDDDRVDDNRTKTDIDVTPNLTLDQICNNGRHKLNESVYSFFLINLERRKNRLEAIESTLPPSICRKTCRIPAADSRNMSRPEYISEEDWQSAQDREKYHKRVGGETLTLGAIGLIESSYRVWKRIVSLSKTAVVMEDDVVIEDEQQMLDALCTMHEDDRWQMAKLQYKHGKADAQRHPNLTKGSARGETGMYAITPGAALKLTERLEGNTTRYQLDGAGGILNEVLTAVYHVKPQIAFQKKDIHGKRMGTDVQIPGRSHKEHCKINLC